MSVVADPVDAVRQLNRVITQRFGLLRTLPYGRGLTLPQARILFELAQAERSLSALGELLDLDLGYISRLVSRLVSRKLVRRRAVVGDKRTKLLSLTASGRRVFTAIDATSRTHVQQVLAGLSTSARAQLATASDTVATLLRAASLPTSSPASPSALPSVVIREARPGDLGWIVSVHGERYARDYGWDATFEGLVAEIVAKFATQHDAAQERCWIAELDGARVGSVMVVRHPEQAGVAKLRLLIVDPRARGLGIGKRLVQQCASFATSAGYQRISLWTNSVLHAARALYVADGYQLVHEEAHHSFGVDLVGETWERAL